jgi:hypothetical protein
LPNEPIAAQLPGNRLKNLSCDEAREEVVIECGGFALEPGVFSRRFAD